MQSRLPGFGEFIALIAMLSSLTALSIDAMLPAMQIIGQELGVAHENDVQHILTSLFLGLACGQILVGPLSDAAGRKPLMYAGLGIFMLGSLITMLSQDFTQMLIGRFMQGLGASAPRVLTMALVRDCYSGRAMARVLSFAMTVFVLVPMLAPSLGQGIMWLADWRAIFGSFLLLAAGVSLWFFWRVPETLSPEKRRPFAFHKIWQGLLEVLTTRQTITHTLALGMVFAAFLGYLSSSQQILQIQYGLGELFPLYFAILAFAIGSASFVNAKLVMRYGMQRLSRWAIILFTLLAVVFLTVTCSLTGQPPLWMLLIYLGLSFLAIGMLFGNLNALAMEPLGHLAGIGASVVGSLSTLIAIPLGTVIGQAYNGTVLPLASGFFIMGLLAAGILLSEGKRI